jgi:SDR family mycofactocin-dependent oxidoreductase
MGQLEGKVAVITGAARGQGRSHAVRLAEEGADIIALDICRQIETVVYPMSTPDDLRETARLVKKQGRRAFIQEVDVRDRAALASAVSEGVAALGRLDFVSANAGIFQYEKEGTTPQAFDDAIDVMLTGVHHTVMASVDAIRAHGEGGSIALTSSNTGLRAPALDWSGMTEGILGYVAAKHGVVGLMRAYSNALAPYNIRVNSVHPTGVRTQMVVNDSFEPWVTQQPWRGTSMGNSMPVDMIEPIDVSNALVYLFADSGRFVTGVTLPVDAGCQVL